MNVLKHAGAFAPSALIALMLVGALMGGQPELLVLLALVGLQVVWAAVWYGAPWAARKVGAAVGS